MHLSDESEHGKGIKIQGKLFMFHFNMCRLMVHRQVYTAGLCIEVEDCACSVSLLLYTQSVHLHISIDKTEAYKPFTSAHREQGSCILTSVGAVKLQ